MPPSSRRSRSSTPPTCCASPTSGRGEGIGAVLPCFWVYLAVGRALEGAGSPHPLYARWIATYASAEFEAMVRPVIAAADAVAERLTQAQRAAVAAHFLTTTRLEWMFFEMGLRREQWPV
jgi:thiaminase/transcriptional activator TenA